MFFVEALCDTRHSDANVDQRLFHCMIERDREDADGNQDDCESQGQAVVLELDDPDVIRKRMVR